MSKTREQVESEMKARCARIATPMLCEALVMLDSKQDRDAAERLTRAVLMDVLCERHPEADAAFQAWADSDSLDMTCAAPLLAAAALEAYASARV